jgi:hypothetical protein
LGAGAEGEMTRPRTNAAASDLQQSIRQVEYCDKYTCVSAGNYRPVPDTGADRLEGETT